MQIEMRERTIEVTKVYMSTRTTEIYTHVSKDAFNKIVSPLDGLKLRDE